MKKILLGISATAAIAFPLAAVAGSASAAQPTTTTHNITMKAASEEVIDLPALNGQFTSMVIKVNDGTANWGDLPGYWTTYVDGTMKPGVESTTGIYHDYETGIDYGPLLREHTQVGAVVYSTDGGQTWNEVTKDPITLATGKHVQVAYNDRPGSYGDNSGSLSLTVVRTKA